MSGTAATAPADVLAEDISRLRPISQRPPLGAYIKDLWRRRHFLLVFASARRESMASNNRLGRYWFIISPILSAATYWFVFGVLLEADKGIPNYIAYLVTGMFFFSFTSGAMTQGANSLYGAAGLIGSLHFPRAAIPLSNTIELIYRLVWELLVLCAIVLITGEPITLMWLLLPVVVALQTIFNAGLALIMARLTFQVRDIKQVLPYLTRTWMFLSGVMFSLATYAQNAPRPVQILLEINPLAIYLNLAREVLMVSEYASPGTWVLGIVWAIIIFIVGFIYFWRAEASYGRN